MLLFLFYGTFSISILMFLALLQSYFVAGHHFVVGRIWASTAALSAMIIAWRFVRRHQYAYASYVLIGIYALVAIAIGWRWGINLPIGLLFSCITIVLAGILLGPAKTLYTAGFLIGSLILLQTGLEHDIYHPDLSWAARTSNYGDVVGYSAIFAMLALISWLFGREVVRSLARAEQAEAGLLQEKLLLESRVVERTAKIRVMQLEKVEQLHRFAELGQLSTAMMHELANRLTSLSMDIETLHGQHRSDALKRAQHSLRYIDSMAKNVSKRLHDLPIQRPFDVVEHTKKAVKSLHQKAMAANVSILIDAPKDQHLKGFGDTVQFAQIMTIVITNAIEAYDGLPTPSQSQQSLRTVNITFLAPGKHIVIRVIDHGKGIPGEQRQRLFEPFNSNKKQGMGVGLYIAKTILKKHFKGNIRLNSATDRTEFVITLPLLA